MHSMESQLIPNSDKLINGEYDNEFVEFLKERHALLKNLILSEVVDVKSRILNSQPS
ncbi:MAG: hypothetical protein WA118_01415 [Carboxydocellales bacterium]